MDIVYGEKTNIFVMFYVIGLGLGSAEDITVRGLEIVKKAERVYLEAYTSILTVGKEVLVRLCLLIFRLGKIFFLEYLVKIPNRLGSSTALITGRILFA